MASLADWNLRFDKKDSIVFFDFDNTISSFDVFDGIVTNFSVDKEWIKLEHAWKAGKIGSKECLEGQLRSVRVTKPELMEYLSTIEIDPYYEKICDLFSRKGIESMIVSDSFTFFIKEILKFKGIKGTRIFANQIRFEDDRLIPSFPYQSPDCKRCAHCKTRHLLENAYKTKIYVGDGLSDICPAVHADLVFAKESLLEHFKSSGRSCLEFKDLRDIYAFFEESGLPDIESEESLASV